MLIRVHSEAVLLLATCYFRYFATCYFADLRFLKRLPPPGYFDESRAFDSVQPWLSDTHGITAAVLGHFALEARKSMGVVQRRVG